MSVSQVSLCCKWFPQPKIKLSRFQLVSLTGTKSTKPSIEKKKYGAIVTRAALEDSSKPLAVILGWNDGKIKHLKKYSQIFENKDWSTVCLPTKSINTFFRADTKVKTISYYMIDLIRELTEKDNPVLLYAFSNGGCAVYFHMAEAILNPGHPQYNAFKVAGLIFDSCPVKPSMDRVPGVQISMTERMKNPITQFLAWHSIGLVMPFVINRSKLMPRYFQDLGKMPLYCPLLILYSKADHLALSQDIDEHIDDRKSQGVQVLSKCWEDSGHVAHYMKYPEEYTELVENYLDVCFKKQKL